MRFSLTALPVGTGTNLLTFHSVLSSGEGIDFEYTIVGMTVNIVLNENVVAFDSASSKDMAALDNFDKSYVTAWRNDCDTPDDASDDVIVMVVKKDCEIYKRMNSAGDTSISVGDVVMLPSGQVFPTGYTFILNSYGEVEDAPKDSSGEIDLSEYSDEEYRYIAGSKAAYSDIYAGDVAFDVDEVKDISFVMRADGSLVDLDKSTDHIETKSNRKEQTVQKLSQSSVKKLNAASDLSDKSIVNKISKSVQLEELLKNIYAQQDIGAKNFGVSIGIKDTAIYDEDGSDKTENDRITFGFDCKLKNFTPKGFFESHGKIQLPDTAGLMLTYTEENEIRFKSEFTGFDLKDLIKALKRENEGNNKKFSVGELAVEMNGVDMRNEFVIACVGIPLYPLSVQKYPSFDDAQAVSTLMGFDPMAVIMISIDLSGEISANVSYTYTRSSYHVKGLRIDREKKSLFGNKAKDAEESKDSFDVFGKRYTVTSCNVEQASSTDTSQPEGVHTISAEGKAEIEAKLGVGVGLLISGLMPICVKGGIYEKVHANMKGTVSYSKKANKKMDSDVLGKSKSSRENFASNLDGELQVSMGIFVGMYSRFMIKYGFSNHDEENEKAIYNTIGWELKPPIESSVELTSWGLSSKTVSGNVKLQDKESLDTVSAEKAKIKLVRQDSIENPVEVSTDEEGNFEFTNVLSGKYNLYVYKEGYVPVKEEIEVEDASIQNKKYTLKMLAHELNIKVASKDDEGPLGMAKISIQRKADSFSGSKKVLSGVTDRSGAAVFNDMICGSYVVQIEADGYKKFVSAINIMAGEKEDATTKISENYELEKNAVILSKPVIDSEGISTWDCVYFGNYMQNGTTKTPIKWRVLSVTDDTTFLMADSNLDARAYHDTSEDVTWETSDIRKWMNSDFLQAAFSEDEQSAIVTAVVSNKKNPTYDTTGGKDTKDKVYLLSIDEVTKSIYGFAADEETSESRVSKNTEYVAKGGSNGAEEMEEEGQGDFWWLRSSGNDSCFAATVDFDGTVYAFGDEVRDDNLAVRPVLHMDLTKIGVYSLAGSVSSDGEVSDKLMAEK